MLILFFCETTIYLRILFCLATKRELSGEINMEICIIGKTKNINSEKTVSQFSLKP